VLLWRAGCPPKGRWGWSPPRSQTGCDWRDPDSASPVRERALPPDAERDRRRDSAAPVPDRSRPEPGERERALPHRRKPSPPRGAPRRRCVRGGRPPHRGGPEALAPVATTQPTESPGCAPGPGRGRPDQPPTTCSRARRTGAWADGARRERDGDRPRHARWVRRPPPSNSAAPAHQPIPRERRRPHVASATHGALARAGQPGHRLPRPSPQSPQAPSLTGPRSLTGLRPCPVER
jgi:hypothetical protein